jgi:hypothetical protein
MAIAPITMNRASDEGSPGLLLPGNSVREDDCDGGGAGELVQRPATPSWNAPTKAFANSTARDWRSAAAASRAEIRRSCSSAFAASAANIASVRVMNWP